MSNPGIKKAIPVMLFLFSIVTLHAQESSGIIFHPPQNPSRASAPFSEAVQVGNTFYLSGQIGMDRSVNQMAGGGIQGETRQAIRNIEGVLKYHGMDLGNVVKCTVILSDIDDFQAFNEVYVQYFPNKPARTTYAAAGLALGARIEIDVIAVKTE